MIDTIGRTRHTSAMTRWWKIAISGAGGIVAALLLLWVVLGPLTWLVAGDTVYRVPDPKERADAVNAVRQSIIGSLAGLGALAAIVFTARNYLLSREGQVTDRFTKAVSQLASERTDERIGGAYALERVMIDSPRDHYTVIEVLSAFVREHAKLPAVQPASDETTADVQAALTVLGRRPERPQLEPRPINLIRTWLPRADLRDGRLRGVVLCGANLRGADLIRTQLQGAHLDGADLRDTKGLTAGQVRDARGLDDPRTRLPEDFSA
ncbi:pentapeptide repeat-containing protein [Actinomycetes bacterium KLBMP 9797]